MKKMALVPHSMVDKLMHAQREEQQLVSNTPLTQLSLLDQQLKEVLESNEPSDIKAKKYAQVLQTYTNIRDNEIRIPRVEPPQIEASPEWLTGLAANYINKGRILSEHVKLNPYIKWNDKNEILYKGNLVQGSNVIDLIHAFVKKTTAKPTGWREFGRALLDSNVPRTAIANEHVLRLLQAEVQPAAQPSTSRAKRPSTSRAKRPSTDPVKRIKAKEKKDDRPQWSHWK